MWENGAAEPRWQPWFGRDLPEQRPVIGHCDVGPWNWLASADGVPYALVDWEFAGPVDALWEVAAAAWLNAQLHDDDVAEMHALPDLPVRARQARAVLDGYGLTVTDRAGMVHRMIEFAVHQARAEALAGGVSVSAPAGVHTDDEPVAVGDHLAHPERIVHAAAPPTPREGRRGLTERDQVPFTRHWRRVNGT